MIPGLREFGAVMRGAWEEFWQLHELEDSTTSGGAEGHMRETESMTDADVLAAIRACHLKANIAGYEAGQEGAVVHWDRACLDPGGTIFGPGPYAKVPITLHYDPPVTVGNLTWATDEIVVRVYAPERLRKRLAALWRPADALEQQTR